MKTSKEQFRAWLAPMLAPLPKLPGDLEYNEMLKPSVRCCSCGKLFEWPCDISEYEPEPNEKNYCGSSPSCCP